jgi:formylglycine-generating enzyme required for sulfatase activity
MTDPSTCPEPGPAERSYYLGLLARGRIAMARTGETSEGSHFSAVFGGAASAELSRAGALRLLDRYGDALLAPASPTEATGREPLLPSDARYQIADELGRGGMGAVFTVRDRTLDRELAMKVLLAPPPTLEAGPADQRRRRRFLREARITGQLDHPGVLPVHELGEDRSGHLFFTMRRVTGDDLGCLFEDMREKGGAREMNRALRLLQRVCETVAYAHHHGIVHRDLKPPNVLVGERDEIFVTDWGLAFHWGEEQEEEATSSGEPRGNDPLRTAAGTVLGTPAYMAPEQALGLREGIGPRTDVYALGAILYQLLNGHPPFVVTGEKTPATAVLEALADGPPPTRAGSPPELVSISRKAMACDPADRYRDAGGLATDLDAYLEGRAVAAHGSGAWTQLAKWIGRHRSLAAVMAAVLILVPSILVKRGWDDRERANLLQSFTDITRIHQLEDQARHLWPARPERVGEYEEWLSAVEEHREKLEDHRTENLALKEMYGKGNSVLERWHLESQRSLIQETERLLEGTTIPDVKKRRTIARRLTGVIDDPRWLEFTDSIDNDPRSPYSGLSIPPQHGLLPLGPDPDTHYWEFAHLPTGDPPRGRGLDGEWLLEPETGVILVLLPGGVFTMGASPEEGGKEDEYVLDENGEYLPQTIWLEPFFLSKYEMTWAQWNRIIPEGQDRENPGEELHPAARLMWNTTKGRLTRFELELPTEARWEYAARGGTESPWWSGEEPEQVIRCEHILSGGSDSPTGSLRVGSRSSNPFGLHDILGNVSEVCIDYYGSYHLPPAPGDGYRWIRSLRTVIRGGSFDLGVERARSACRADPGRRGPSVGVRPARDLER